MASAVEADLRQLRLAMGLYERYDRAVSTADIHAEIAARLREELDYGREAAHMRLYREILKDETKVAVPEPVAALSTKRLLTMRWLEGGRSSISRRTRLWSSATRSRSGCSASGTCRSISMASSTATRISAITRWRRTAP